MKKEINMENNNYYTPETKQELLTYLISEGRIWGKDRNDPDHVIEINISEELISGLDMFIQYNNMSESPNGTKHFGIDRNLYLIKSLDEEDFRTLNLKLVREAGSNNLVIKDSNDRYVGLYYPEDEVNMELFCGNLFTIKNIYEFKMVLNMLNYASIKEIS